MWDPSEKEVVEFTVSAIKFIEAHGTLEENYVVYCAGRGPMCEPSDCYSSPEAVPGGGE
jgi:hypothetical protein